MGWQDTLIKRIPNTIRRFHATSTEKLPSIVKQGLLPLDPGTDWATSTGDTALEKQGGQSLV